MSLRLVPLCLQSHVGGLLLQHTPCMKEQGCTEPTGNEQTAILPHKQSSGAAAADCKKPSRKRLSGLGWGELCKAASFRASMDVNVGKAAEPQHSQEVDTAQRRVRQRQDQLEAGRTSPSTNAHEGQQLGSDAPGHASTAGPLHVVDPCSVGSGLQDRRSSSSSGDRAQRMASTSTAGQGLTLSGLRDLVEQQLVTLPGAEFIMPPPETVTAKTAPLRTLAKLMYPDLNTDAVQVSTLLPCVGELIQHWQVGRKPPLKPTSIRANIKELAWLLSLPEVQEQMASSQQFEQIKSLLDEAEAAAVAAGGCWYTGAGQFAARERPSRASSKHTSAPSSMNSPAAGGISAAAGGISAQPAAASYATYSSRQPDSTAVCLQQGPQQQGLPLHTSAPAAASLPTSPRDLHTPAAADSAGDARSDSIRPGDVAAQRAAACNSSTSTPHSTGAAAKRPPLPAAQAQLQQQRLQRMKMLMAQLSSH